jgi:hypothetical protein
MTNNTRTRLLTGFGATLGIAAMLTSFGSAATQKFFNDDPIWVEHDTEDASGMKPLEVNLTVDLIYNSIAGRDPVASVRAKNLNTVDEVPDSSWFTNRAGHRPLSTDDIAKGPDTTSGPAPGPWTVTSSKSDGVTPGFTIKDANGQRWFLKFDPRGHRGMATGTEVVVTKLMWALGYYVPENHIAYLRPEQLIVGNGAKFTPAGGKERAMRISDVGNLLQRVEREPDGSYRAVASKGLPGKPIGRVRFYDTRPDDPNDIVPHEDRRELRAYGVFAAWLNHVDAKAINSLDMLVTGNGRSFVRHNIIDFGSALGSGGVAPADYWAGSQYLVQPGDIGRQMMGLGFTFPAWHTTRFYEARSIGRLPADNTRFNPELWRPRVPNQAFLHARADDKFWAAQRLVALTTDLLRAAVHEGDFGDPASEEFLVRALAERRDAIARAYLAAVNPITDVALGADGILRFRNAAVDADVARMPEGYRAVWSTFDNNTGATARISEATSRTTQFAAPANLPVPEGAYIKVDLSAVGGVQESWTKPAHAYFRHLDGAWKLVGFERLTDDL